MSDKDTNSSEMPKKKSRQSLKVTLRKNIFWIKIFLGVLLGLLLFFFRVLDTMRSPSSKLRVVTPLTMFSKLSMSVISCGRTVGLLSKGSS